jgi:hypothetical protein
MIAPPGRGSEEPNQEELSSREVPKVGSPRRSLFEKDPGAYPS